MSDFFAFMLLGVQHIVGLEAADHVLFLLVLSAIYRGRDWRAALVVISAFTVGHSMTLILAVTGVMILPSRLVEFLIPITIVATALENLVWRDRATNSRTLPGRPLFAVLFGLVHGAGFAGYLTSLFVDRMAIPLLGFNIGIELGQIVVLAGAALVYWVSDVVLAQLLRATPPDQRFQQRLVLVSSVGLLLSTAWAIARYPR